MTRTPISSATPADQHGDEGQGVYSVEEEAFIAHRSDELLAERLADRSRFHDLLSGIDAQEIEPHLFRALANLDSFIRGERAGMDAVTTALSLIQFRRQIEAQHVWADGCREEAERQAKEVFA